MELIVLGVFKKKLSLVSAGQWQDDHPGAGEPNRSVVCAGPGAPVRQVCHGIGLGRDQAQDRHPNPRREMHEQGAGVGRAGHTRSRPPGDQHSLRPAPAGEELAVHHMDGQMTTVVVKFWL